MHNGCDGSFRLNRAYVEIGNICNLSCSFCAGTRREPRQMTEEEFRFVLTALQPHTDYLYLHVMGEPLLHDLLGRFLEIAGELGFRVCITTNGTLLGERGGVLLDRAETIHKVSVSLHSMEGNGIEALGAYLDSVTDFASRAAERGIYTVYRLWNLDSEEGSGANGDNAAIEAHLKKLYPDEWQKRWNGYRLAERIFLEYAGVFTWPTESEAEPIDTGSCHGVLDQIAVLADGSVVPCCLDCEGEILLGNIYATPLRDILSSERASAMREGFRSGRMVERLCKTCTYARRFGK